MTRPDDVPRVADLMLERYRLGELEPADTRELERRLRDDATLRERLVALEHSDGEIRRRYPTAWFAERVRARVAAARPAPARSLARPGHWLLPGLAATAAMVLLVLAPRLVGPPPAGPGAAVRGESADRIKGLAPSLQLFRKTLDASETLADGAVARQGDVIRVGYRAAGRAFGVILSVDGRGAVTLHLPVRGEEAAPLPDQAAVLLDHAYELDDAPGFERFFLVTAASPFPVPPVVDAVRHAARTGAAELELAAPLEQTTFLLRKGGRP